MIQQALLWAAAGTGFTFLMTMIGAAMVLSGQWSKKGVYTTDEFDPDPYMQMLNEYGLPWVVEENPETVA